MILLGPLCSQWLENSFFKMSLLLLPKAPFVSVFSFVFLSNYFTLILDPFTSSLPVHPWNTWLMSLVIFFTPHLLLFQCRMLCFIDIHDTFFKPHFYPHDYFEKCGRLTHWRYFNLPFKRLFLEAGKLKNILVFPKPPFTFGICCRFCSTNAPCESCMAEVR